MKKKIIILWVKDIDHLILEDDNDFIVGGIHIQMLMWGKTFSRNNWKVYSFTNKLENAHMIFEGIEFLYFPSAKYINPLLTVYFTFYNIIQVHPNLILVNGAIRDLFIINLISKLFKITTIEMFASDSDLKPGKELIASKHDRFLYRCGLKLTKNFVVQNKNQSELLATKYKKNKSLLIPLIWVGTNNQKIKYENRDLILWVSNFRALKRPEWFIKLAQDKPQYEFVMIGYPTDKELFKKCKQEVLKIPNLSFLGGLSFEKTNELFKRARLFVCTSEIEGFPNTFIQAWMNGCPVLTTYDPSGLIKDLNLGIYGESYSDIYIGFDLLTDNVFYKLASINARKYFEDTFSSQMHYERLIERFKLL